MHPRVTSQKTLRLLLLLLVHFISLVSSANNSTQSLWEYGIGAGYFVFEQYPSSDQSNFLFLGFPTFQYWGEKVQVNDRSGAKAFLWKGENFILDISGAFQAGQISGAQNRARDGMPKIPWSFSVGPQLVFEIEENWFIKAGAFPSLRSDLNSLKSNGMYLDTRIVRNWRGTLAGRPHFLTASSLAFSLQAASQEYLSGYFEVPTLYATAERPAFDAKSGLLSYRASFYQTVSTGLTNVYFSTSIIGYDLSANRQSPLHKSNFNYSFSIGLNYILGESKKNGVAEDEVQGFFNKKSN